MSKVAPLEFEFDPSTSKSRIGIVIALATKVVGIVTKQFDTQHSPTSSVHSVESGERVSVEMQNNPVYQQSSTRRLAFGSTSVDTPKPQKDFYNNNTLVNLSKLFCAVVLLTAFVLVMTRSLSQFVNRNNSTNTNDSSFFYSLIS
ncbi:hypothetical protein DICVIV_00255 [Dictyocaulus viviparus]|uniref:Uncharacterized protein n=1 Tax=Dictyocaulus viviparus TaxID=29172 RepID=A0A0D8YBC8_DICVI|nr:hypothetical protein DICVIV_00255 [Dictyocaulus viviparus]